MHSVVYSTFKSSVTPWCVTRMYIVENEFHIWLVEQPFVCLTWGANISRRSTELDIGYWTKSYLLLLLLEEMFPQYW